MSEKVVIGNGARIFFLCHTATGKEIQVPVPPDPQVARATLALLKGAYGSAQKVVEWHGKRGLRMGIE